MMNVFRSLLFMRAVVLLVAALVLHDSVDTRQEPIPTTVESSAKVLIKAADEPGSDDWEGRFSGTEIHLWQAPLYEVDIVSPYTFVTIHFPNTIDRFKSVPSELPSPPPKV